jgi:hypothetical protein
LIADGLMNSGPIESGGGGRQRTVVFRMDPIAGGLLGEMISALAGLAGGALGLEALKRWGDRQRKKREEPLELTAKILDDGDALRTLLLEEVKRLQTEKDACMERAHKAEMGLAVTQGEMTRLQTRLERKDEQNKALQQQLITAGQVPVVLTAPNGRREEG